MEKSNKLFIAVVALTVLFLTNIVCVLALQSFTDVRDDYWAKDYIEKMAKKGIVTGYPDATFRPSENVDKLATTVMIFRTLKAADKLADVDFNRLVQEYSQVLNRYNIPTWGKEAVAVAMEKNIINENDVKRFLKADGSLEKATRTDVTILLGKALNIYLREELKSSIITFDFNDAEFISSEAAPYVDLLIRKNIIKGDENGNFNPNKPIVRSAAAKMFSLSYDILGGIEADNVEKDLTAKEAEISVILEDEEKLVVIEKNGKNSLYKIEDNTKIIIEDRSSSLKYLEEGQRVTLYVDEYGRLSKLEADTKLESLGGKIHNISNMGSYYLLTVEDKDSGKRRSYKANDDTFVLFNDKDGDIKDLEKGDDVSLSLEGDMIEKIIAQSKKREYEGILESSVVFNQYPKLVIKSYTQKVYELEIDGDVEVKKNNKTRKLTDLNKGDIVRVKTEYDKVVEIIATSVEVESEDEGIITEITLGNENKITIENEDGETKTYTVASDVDIEIDNENSTINDLKIDYRVELKIENGEITDIEAEEVESSGSIAGTITEIFEDYDAITVKVKGSGKTKYISVLANDADIISTNGRERNFSYLEKDDEIFIYGKEENKIFDFVADKIIILKKN